MRDCAGGPSLDFSPGESEAEQASRYGYVDTCNSMRTLRLGDDCDQSQMMKVLLTHR